MNAEVQAELEELQNKWRRFRVEELSEFDVKTLSEHSADLEQKNRDAADRITDLENQLNELKEALGSDLKGRLDNLTSLADAALGCTYDRARILEVSQQSPISARLVLEVDATSGETMHMFPGDTMVVSSADYRDFVALENSL